MVQASRKGDGEIRHLQVPLPDAKQREAILRVTLQRHHDQSPIAEELRGDSPMASGERPLQVIPSSH